VVNTNVKTSTTIQLDVKKIGELQFEMAGPGCVPSEADIVADSVIEEQTLATKTGYEFDLECDKETGCCMVVQVRNPDNTVKDFRKIAIDNFLENIKGSLILKFSVPGVPCPGIVGEDSSEESPWYCSGGWCYY
jgi:hypothetical protein